MLTKKISLNSKIKFLIKIIVTGGGIYWVLENQGFDYEEILIGLTNLKLASLFIILCFFQLIIGAIRSTFLMQFKQVSLSKVVDVLNITWASSFFSCIIPVALASEAYRIRYLMLVDKEVKEDNSVYTAFYSKIFSFLSLLLIALGASFFVKNLPPVLNYSLKGSGALVFLFLILGIAAQNLNYSKYLDKIKTEFLKKRIEIFLSYNKYFSSLKSTMSLLGLSLCLQLLNVFSIFLIIRGINPVAELNYFELFSVIPIGIFLTLIPISISGLGVGHFAFSKLLAMFGIMNGADIFTLFFAFSYIFNLLGIIPFLFKQLGNSQVYE